LFVFVFSPLMRQWQNYFTGTNTRIGGWRTNTNIVKTNHIAFELGDVFLSSLCLSHACLAYRWLVHYLSLFISLALFFFFKMCVCLFVCFVFFPFSLPSFSPFHYRYHHCYYCKLENTELHTVQGQ
jgi:hypothetical protein